METSDLEFHIVFTLTGVNPDVDSADRIEFALTILKDSVIDCPTITVDVETNDPQFPLGCELPVGSLESGAYIDAAVLAGHPRQFTIPCPANDDLNAESTKTLWWSRGYAVSITSA